MVQQHEILNFVDRVVKRFRPEKVILFGSYAYGKPTDDSDVDLLIVTRSKSRATSVAGKIRLECRATFPMDILVRDKREIEQRLRWHDFFLMDVMEQGILLYDASRQGMAAKS